MRDFMALIMLFTNLGARIGGWAIVVLYSFHVIDDPTKMLVICLFIMLETKMVLDGYDESQK